MQLQPQQRKRLDLPRELRKELATLARDTMRRIIREKLKSSAA